MNRPRTLEMPRCCATAPTVEWAGSIVHGPGAGSDVSPWRVNVTVPSEASPEPVTRAVAAVGDHPMAVMIATYGPGARTVSSVTTPSSSASARST